jgi:hypothetical protein
MDRARRRIALSGGEAGREDWLRANCGRVEAVALDFDHAGESLGALGRASYPAGEAARAARRCDWCHRLKHEGGAAVRGGLRGPEVRGRAARETWAAVARDFANQSHRMDDPRDVARGWASGSGPVESACETAIGQRMKGAGMRWGEDGADSVSHLRALFKSGDRQWDGSWHPAPNWGGPPTNLTLTPLS